MTNLQKYLFSFPSIKEGLNALSEEYSINVKEYTDEGVYCLKYNQIESIKTNPIVQECRGIVIDTEGNIVCRPFDRFFNYGEIDTNFNFSHATILEKIDGSLIKIAYYNGKWNAGTSGTAFAETSCSSGESFLYLIERTIGKSIDAFMWNASKNHTFLFELTTRENRVVKPYSEDNLYLIGIRNNETGEYTSYDNLCLVSMIFNVPVPEKYSLNSFEDIQKMFNEIGEMDEGFVCWDEKTGERVKCKNPSYIHFHHLRDNGVLNPKRISELVFLQDYEEYLNAFPEDKKYFLPYIMAYSSLLLDIKTVYEENKDIENQKEFALNVVKYPFNSILFQMRKGEDLYNCLKSLTSDKKLNLLENYF